MRMAKTARKSRFPNCGALRESAGVSMSRFAGLAGVGRDLIRSLEQGKPHSRHKVMLVFNALQDLHGGSLCVEIELVLEEAEDGTAEET